jgi:hypothetical protein
LIAKVECIQVERITVNVKSEVRTITIHYFDVIEIICYELISPEQGLVSTVPFSSDKWIFLHDSMSCHTVLSEVIFREKNTIAGMSMVLN